MFGGSESLEDFDDFLNSLEVVIRNQNPESRTDRNSFHNLKKLIKDVSNLFI